MRHARRTLDLALTEDHGVRAGAAGFLGLAFWTSGDLEAAHPAWAQCAAGLRRSGQIADIFGCAIAMADIRLVQGRLGEAMRTYEQALQRASEQDGPVLRGTADMYVGMSEVHRERGDLQAATQQLLRSQELGEHNGLPQNPYRWRVAMARIRQAEGDLGGALDLLNEAERLYVGDFFPNVRPVPALKARVWIAQGRLGEALGWAREQGLSADDDLSYLREFEHITLARMLLARSRGEPVHQVTGLLERLLLAAEEGGRTGHVIEILVLQALALQASGHIPAALTCLERALTLAEPEGYVRVFADEGAPMASLLRAAAKLRTAGNYVRRLLAAVGETGQHSPFRQARQASPDRSAERTRARGAPAARNRTGRPGHRPRAHGVPEHRADAHQEHLRQARRNQPPGRGPPGRGTRPAAGPQPVTLLSQSLMPAINALLLGSLMYRSRLVPRIIPAIGLIGAPFLICTVIATLFGAMKLGSPELAAVPVAAWEFSLGVWLVVKGFRPSPITAAMDAASTPPAYQDVAV